MVSGLPSVRAGALRCRCPVCSGAAQRLLPSWRERAVGGLDGRFLQVSAALPEGAGACRARGIPIDLVHCPSTKKSRRNASPEELAEVRRLQKHTKVSTVGVARITELRAAMDADSENRARPLIVSADGSFTNKTVFRALPPNTTVIGRIRKDARLFQPPESTSLPRRGRRSYYGSPPFVGLVPAIAMCGWSSSAPWPIVLAKARTCYIGTPSIFCAPTRRCT